MARLKGFQKLTCVDEALETWLRALQINVRTVTVPLQEALNRVSAEDVIAQEDLPRFDKSAVDGYALKAEDTTGATQFKPATLTITDSAEIGAKQAKQLWTGNPIPKGADAVVMIENTRKRDDGKLDVWVPLAPNANVSRKGEDIQKGETATKKGTRLNPYHLGLFAALGNTSVKVAGKPRIAIIATGNELAKTGTTPTANQIFESNRVMLSAMCRELGAEPVDLGIAKDDIDEIAEKIKTGLHQCDAVVTTGGTSVGGLDLVPDAVNNTGKPGVIVHGIAMRPAMPTALAAIDGKPVLILSGNPVAAVIGFEAFARPLICKMLGMSQEETRPIVRAVMTRKVATALGRRTFVRVLVTQKNGEFTAEPVSTRGSGTISTMTRSNGFVIVSENREGLAQGELVAVRLFGTVETVKVDV
ncbi:molybdopterin molybdotransferase MoeA [Candidatus Bathyarchaeota archaeon A05DMB-2]|nr:molybdopterin molybdotransferase MoeA [Candidatus Bathyarchaeota archaeon A05DMB-2]